MSERSPGEELHPAALQFLVSAPVFMRHISDPASAPQVHFVPVTAMIRAGADTDDEFRQHGYELAPDCVNQGAAWPATTLAPTERAGRMCQ